MPIITVSHVRAAVTTSGPELGHQRRVIDRDGVRPPGADQLF